MSTTTALNNLFIDIVKQQADQLLKGKAVLSPRIANKMDTVPGVKGKKIKVPIPEMPSSLGTFSRGSDVSKQDRAETAFKDVELTVHVCDDYPVYRDEWQWMYLNPEAFFTLKIAPRWEALIRDVERAGFKLHVDMENVYGTCGDPPDAKADLAAMQLKADEQYMPEDQRFYFCEPTAYGDLLQISEVITALQYGSPDVIRQGRLPEVFGFYPQKSLYLKNANGGWHTCGGWYDATTPVVKDDSNALAIGDTAITIDGLAVSTAAEVKDGDRFTLAGDTTIYTVTATVTSTSGGAAALTIIPGLVADPGDGAAVTVLQTSATGKYIANLFAHPAGLYYASTPVAVDPAPSQAVANISIPGVGTITYDIWEDKRANAMIHRTQVLYGWAVGQQDLSFVVLG